MTNLAIKKRLLVIWGKGDELMPRNDTVIARVGVDIEDKVRWRGVRDYSERDVSGLVRHIDGGTVAV